MLELREVEFRLPERETEYTFHTYFDAFVTMDCLLNCGGEHQFAMRILRGEEGLGMYEHQRPKPNACSSCGNLVALSQPMIDTIYEQATEWLKPHIAAWEEKRDLRNMLAERFFEITQEKHSYAGETLHWYNVDLLRVYHEEAGGDLEKFEQLVSGSWEEVVIPLLKYCGPSEYISTKWPPAFQNHQMWRRIIWGQGTEAERLQSASRRFFVRTGRLSELYVMYDWFLSSPLADTEGEVYFLLDKLSEWRAFGNGSQQFRVTKFEKEGNFYPFYRLELR